MELFSTYQDWPDMSDFILGHISLIQLRRRSFSHKFVTVFHHSAERYCICFVGHYSHVFYRDGFSVEHDIQIILLRLCQIIRFKWRWTLTVGYFELEVSDSSWHLVRHRDPVGWVMRLCSQLIWSFWLASRAYFETRGVPFHHFHWIKSCSSMLHWGIFHSFIISL